MGAEAVCGAVSGSIPAQVLLQGEIWGRRAKAGQTSRLVALHCSQPPQNKAKGSFVRLVVPARWEAFGAWGVSYVPTKPSPSAGGTQLLPARLAKRSPPAFHPNKLSSFQQPPLRGAGHTQADAREMSPTFPGTRWVGVTPSPAPCTGMAPQPLRATCPG